MARGKLEEVDYDELFFGYFIDGDDKSNPNVELMVGEVPALVCSSFISSAVGVSDAGAPAETTDIPKSNLVNEARASTTAKEKCRSS